MSNTKNRVLYRWPDAVAEEWKVIETPSSNKYVVIWTRPQEKIKDEHFGRMLIGMGLDEEHAWYDALKTIYQREAPHLLKDLKRTIK